MIRRILVGLGDELHCEAATTTAIELALTHGAELTGVAVLDPDRIGATGSVPIGAGHLAAELREHRLAKARWIVDKLHRQFRDACREAGIQQRIERLEGDPYDCLAGEARYHDIIVCGLGHLFEHGVVSEPPAALVKLVERGVRPLIAVTAEHRPMRKALVAYSGSAESAKAMKRFVQLRLWPDMTIRIITFYHKQEIADELLADAQAYCRAHDFEVDTDYRPDSPRDNLLPYASTWDADLIVMGNSTRSLMLRRVFGETMYHVVQQSDRPLFLAQ